MEETQNQQSQPIQKPLQTPRKVQLAPVKGDTTRTDYDVKYEHDRTKKKIWKLRIVYNKKGCLASGHCILSDPYNFTLDSEFRADLKEGKPLGGVQSGTFTKDIETDSPHLVINAAKTCTPRVIAVIDLESGKRIAP